jgi:hypothetical protein
MSDTSAQRCPFKIDTTTDQGIDCETTDCAAWNDGAGECLIIAAAIKILDDIDLATPKATKGL